MPTTGPIRPLFAGIKIQSTRDQDGHDMNSGMMDETDGSQLMRRFTSDSMAQISNSICRKPMLTNYVKRWRLTSKPPAKL
jgi:hypothetical protein